MVETIIIMTDYSASLLHTKKLFVSTNPTDPILCADLKTYFAVCRRF